MKIASTLDLLPTIAKITDSKLPVNKIDGHDISTLISGAEGAKSPTEEFFFYRGWDLEAVRSGKWKLHLPHGYNQVIKSDTGNVHGRLNLKSQIDLALFDLSNDINESNNIAEQHPEIVKSLMLKIDVMKKRPGR